MGVQVEKDEVPVSGWYLDREIEIVALPLDISIA